MVVGTIIGASIFVQPSEVTGQVPSVAGALLVWLTSGLLALGYAFEQFSKARRLPVNTPPLEE